ncbi:MAG TPA: alpha-amylase family glycosyl hydrolase, partial [Anaerolineales bacterium]|nr:alpha-amylase family glycosyl hydrolase [Anaerolineales bacterium]
GAIYSYLVGDPGPPDWSREAIIYQIFPDRFHPGGSGSWRQPVNVNGIYGGTLQGIRDNLDYIDDLGFNCLWLNPIFPDDTHHGYQARDYFHVNPRLGTLDDLEELVEESHRRGIRLLLDFAANHWSHEHPTFQSAVADRDSEYHDWYHWIEWPDRYESYHGIKSLPKLNVDFSAMRNHLLEAAGFWLDEAGFDGFRLDHAHGVSLDFWTDFRRAVKKLKPEAWIFGEVTDSPPRLLEFAGRLDGCLDFLLAQVLLDTFASETKSVTGFDAFLAGHDRFFPEYFSRPSFLDNHDMNRYLFISGGDIRKVKLAALCQFTLSGPPIVYYGTEAGVGQERSVSGPGSHGLAESRQPMVWGAAQNDDLHRFYRWLIRLRRENPALVHGGRRTVHLDEETRTYAYVRSTSEQQVTVAFNLSNRPQSIALSGHRFDLGPRSGDVYIDPSV